MAVKFSLYTDTLCSDPGFGPKYFVINGNLIIRKHQRNFRPKKCNYSEQISNGFDRSKHSPIIISDYQLNIDIFPDPKTEEQTRKSLFFTLAFSGTDWIAANANSKQFKFGPFVLA